MKAELITTTNETRDIAPANGKSFSLAEMQAYVGGYIEIITLPDGQIMVMNEEGALQGLPQNALATVMAHNVITSSRGIVGDVIVCDSELVK